jgi:uncharacterized protein YndB with AHSA1/START domain
MSTDTALSTFHTERTLAHPPEAVYGAFADPALLAAWWGPAGFRNSFELFEFREGGRWQFVMHGPDGASYPNQNLFRELVPGQRVVVRHDGLPFFTLTVELTPVPSGTRLRWTQVLDDAATAQAVAHIVRPANEQNLDRLEAVLAGG